MRRLESKSLAIAFISSWLAVTLVGAAPAHAFESFRSDIPHLDDVPGGCDAMCHATGGFSSPLYLDFETAGFVWNAAMANADSDGDGFSNGWELQDPAHTWSSGPYPGSAALVSNPSSAGSLAPLPVATDPLSLVHTEGAGANGTEFFAIQNVGAVAFDYSIASSDIWMAPDPAAGQGLPANDQDPITVLFTTSGLIAGLYQGDLVISIPGIRADRIPTLPVDLTVPEPDAVAAAVAAWLGLVGIARRERGRS